MGVDSARQTDNGTLPADPEVYEAKVDKAEALYDAIESDGKPLAIEYDMNGPLVSTDTKELHLKDGVKDPVSELPEYEDVAVGINSGYDVQTQTYIRDERLEQSDLYIVGAHGSTYKIGDDVHQTGDTSPETIIEAEQQLFENAADRGRALALQGNKSNTVGAVAVEAEQQANICDHPLAREDSGTDELWETVKSHPAFSRPAIDGPIKYESTLEATQVLSTALKDSHPYMTVSFDTAGDHITVERSREDADIDYETAEQFVETALPDTWSANGNPDWTFDYAYGPIDITKDDGTTALMQQMYDVEDSEDFVLARVGDNPSDIPETENSLFFAQGQHVIDYCNEHDIPHIPAAHGGEFASIMNDLLDRVR